MFIRFCIFFSFLLFMLSTHAQPTIAYNHAPRLFTGVGDTLPLPWAGGLNSVSISAIDLNQDGKNDLVTYDLSGGKIAPFLNIGNVGEMNYRYAPQYISSFPKTIESFILCEDYNGDGKNDLFTYFNAGIKVFKNVSTSSEGLKFEDVTDDVNFPYLTSRYAPGPNGVSNLYVSRGDIPAIVDLDNDGDLDILAFGNSSATVVYHRNLAADSGNLERLDYVASSFCWGNFEESFDSDQLQLGVSCRIEGFGVNNKGNKHAGSTLLAFDRDGDGDKELLVGDISSGKMILLTNGGDSLTANMVSQSNTFPEESKAIELNIYPAAFYVDVNNDGRKDLLVSPNTTGSVENAESVWLYLNTGTTAFTSFSFLRPDFLQSGMIEQGEGLFPAWLDYNNDSLPDLVAGNHGIYNGTQLAISRLTLFTLNADGDFNINQPDMAGLSSILLNSNLNTPTLALAPSFGDLDNDGDMDLLVGDFEGKLHYFTNTSAAGEQANFTLTSKNYFDIDVGGYAVPQLFDLNGDGMLDLIIGERSGNINYYQNVGTTQQAKFELITEKLGGIDLVPPLDFVGYSYPFFFHSNDTLKLLCGAQSGGLFLYDQIEGNLNGDFHLVENAFPSFDVGMRSAISGTDLDGDGLLDLAIGNYSGGLSLYKTNLAYQAPPPPSSKPKQNYDLSFEIVPVPSRGNIRLISSTDNFFSRILTIRIYDVQGKLVFLKKNTTQRSFELPFGKGAFYMEIQDGEQKTMRKFMMM
jgi:hypothetical protein